MIQMAGNGKTRVYILAEHTEDIREAPFGEGVERVDGSGDGISSGEMASADVISVFVRDVRWGEETVRTIRARPPLFLKPLLVLSRFRPEELVEITDDMVTLPVEERSFHSRIEDLSAISRRVRNLEGMEIEGDPEREKEILLLRYLFTREKGRFNPVRQKKSRIGYGYPVVQTLFGVKAGDEIDLLDDLEAADLIRGDLVDRIHLCPFCRHYQVNYREICPDCRSLRIQEEKTIHHFRCAYVGRESEFRQGHSLRCPKCGRNIRHIGVDYDKPATELWCGDCNSNFAEPLISCFCLNCAREFSPEYALPRHIKSYSLTKAGGRAAEAGLLPETGLPEILKHEFGFYRPDVFEELLRLEIHRCTRNDFDSTLGYVAIENLREIVDEGGIARARQLREEIARIFREMLRETDILTDDGEDDILVILTHTNIDQARNALDRIREKSARHFSRKVDLEYRFLALRGETREPADILEGFR